MPSDNSTDMSAPSLYTISPSQPFLSSLAQGILSLKGECPMGLANVQILLPNQRACTALAEELLRLSGQKGLMLPRIHPIDAEDEDDPSRWQGFSSFQELPDVPPPIHPWRRTLLLAQEIQQHFPGYHEGAPLPMAAAVALAEALGAFLDDVQRQRIAPERLQDLVPEELAEHWQISLEFLGLIFERWPEILLAEGVSDFIEHRNLSLARKAQFYRDHPPQTPVIAAGTTGSLPATADVLAAIADLPNGCVVLPGLDQAFSAQAWQELGATHPQYRLKNLLERLDVSRDEVMPWTMFWPATESPSEEQPVRMAGRSSFVRQAFLPATATASWQDDPHGSDRDLERLYRFDCETLQQEAEIIALILRQTAETPIEKGVLVTPNRELADRVRAALKRWNIEIDDSAGTPLLQTPPAIFARLVLEMIMTDFAPVSLLAVLKHPLCDLPGWAGAPDRGQNRQSVLSLARKLEREVLRGPLPTHDLESLELAVTAHPELAAFVTYIKDACAPFSSALSTTSSSLPELISAHVTCLEALAKPETLWGAAGQQQGISAGEALSQALTELTNSAQDVQLSDPSAYGDVLHQLLSARVVRTPSTGTHPQLKILGLLEARLQSFDTVVLGGLNEEDWPVVPTADMWMSRAMRTNMGLDLLEAKIGQSAHDFYQALFANTVYMTRAKSVDGSPQVPSRFLLRLSALADCYGFSIETKPEVLALKRWQQQLDDSQTPITVHPPAPKPPVVVRPTSLSATRIERLIRDPYSIYASKILKLSALEPLEASFDAREKGKLLHAILDEFVQREQKSSGQEPALYEIARDALEKVPLSPPEKTLWWSRFERIADWFLDQWRASLPNLSVSVSEVSGVLDLSNGFKVTATADRIDIGRDGRVEIIDYKTGTPPSKKAVAQGLAPQLPIEALILAHGGFDLGGFEGPQNGISQDISATYWQLRGGRAPGRVIPAFTATSEGLVEIENALTALTKHFQDHSAAYLCEPDPALANKYHNEYAHLARLKEWRPG